MTHPLVSELYQTADSYAEAALYDSRWQRPIDLLRKAARALEGAEVDRNCLRAALKAAQSDCTKQAAAPEAK